MKIRAVDLLDYDLDRLGEQPLDLVDQKKLDAAVEWFVKFVMLKQKNGKIDFYDGYLKEAEGDKQEIYASAHAILKLDAWNTEMIGKHNILDRVLAAMLSKDKHENNTMIGIQEIKEFKKQAEMDLDLAEDMLYRLLKGEPKSVFDDACFLLGRHYHIFSYILFTRDCTKYLPVAAKKDEIYDCFVKLGAETEGIINCTWRGYEQFLKVHEEVRKRLEETLDTHITLLDAHNFIMTLRFAPDDFSFDSEAELEEIMGGRDELQESLAEVILTKDFTAEYVERSNRIEESLKSKEYSDQELKAVLKEKINQDSFKKRLFRRYGKCCLCRIHSKELLSASNLKPWDACSPEEKLDVDNGFLFCPNHAHLFEAGLISFTGDGTIIISNELDEVDRVYLNVRPNMRIEIRDGNRKYLEYHREHIFTENAREIEPRDQIRYKID